MTDGVVELKGQEPYWLGVAKDASTRAIGSVIELSLHVELKDAIQRAPLVRVQLRESAARLLLASLQAELPKLEWS